MAELKIIDPGSKSTKQQKFEVTGTSDAGQGAGVSCTISKGVFNEVVNCVVDANLKWSALLGGANPIPVDTDYAINARHTGTTGSDGVNEISVTDKPLIEITDLKIEAAGKDTEWLLVSCRVKENPPFNALSCLVYVHDQKGRATVVSTGWVKPIPADLKYRFRLNAPVKGHKVVHVLGIQSNDDNTGEVIARATSVVKKK
jgi:hypothetical protein